MSYLANCSGQTGNINQQIGLGVVRTNYYFDRKYENNKTVQVKSTGALDRLKTIPEMYYPRTGA